MTSPVTAHILLAVDRHGEAAWSDLSWAKPFSDPQVMGAVSHMVRQGLLVATGEKLGLRRRVYALTDQGRKAAADVRAESEARAAREARVREQAAVLARLRGERHGRSEIRDALMVEAKAAGASLAAIGEAVGVSKQAVDYLLRQMAKA